MKTLICTLRIVSACIILNTGMAYSQDGRPQNPDRYLHQFDSLLAENTRNTDSEIESRNFNLDSVLMVRTRSSENRVYLADSGNRDKLIELQNLMQRLENELNSLKTQAWNRFCRNQQNLRFRFFLQGLDSLTNEAEYMKAHPDQFSDSAIAAIRATIGRKYAKLDSMIKIHQSVYEQNWQKLDSLFNAHIQQIESIFMEKQAKIDSLLGISVRARFRIAEKNAQNVGDTLTSKNRRRLADVALEIVIIDSTDIRIRLAKRLASPQNIRSLFRIRVLASLKSASTDEIGIKDVVWDESKPDVLQIITAEPVTNPELIEIEYDGVVEMTNDDKIVLKDTPGTTHLSSTTTIEDIEVFPNPTAMYIKISNAQNIQSVMMFSLNGSLVGDFTQFKSTEMPTSQLPDGIYLMKMLDHSGHAIVKKIIKKQ